MRHNVRSFTSECRQRLAYILPCTLGEKVASIMYSKAQKQQQKRSFGVNGR